MRTSIYVNNLYWEKLKDAADILNVSVHELVGLLIQKATNDFLFEVKMYEPVQYQESDPEVEWKIKHVEFEPVVYEVALDLRRNFKFSVSWFIAYGIEKYLDDIIRKLLNPENRKNILDNYNPNYIYIAQMYGEVKGFAVFWGYPGEEALKGLL